MLTDKEICRLYRFKKLSCQSIAKIDGRSATTIYLILKSRNVKFRDKSDANKIIPDNALIFLYNLGLSFQQIGSLIGADPSMISKRLSLLHYPIRSISTSINFRYSDEEFLRYFCNDKFLEQFEVLVNGTS